jgi:hypothetical protein
VQEQPVIYFNHIGLDEPASYIIRFQGRLSGIALDDWFQGECRQETEVSEARGAVTSLQGVLSDQSALHGLLKTLRDLGLVLLYLECISARGGQITGSLGGEYQAESNKEEKSE